MPKGMYVRTRPAWNKGQIAPSTHKLLDEINAMIVGSPIKLTIGQIYRVLVTKNILPDDTSGYHLLLWHLTKARCNGMLNGNLIAEGRGRIKHCGVHKLLIGEKVRIISQNPQTPKWLRKGVRLDNCRTVTAIASAPSGKLLHYLGSNRIGSSNLEIYGFRSYELEPYTSVSKRGRPVV